MFQVADGLLVMTRRKFGHGTAMEIDGLTVLLTRGGPTGKQILDQYDKNAQLVLCTLKFK